MSRKLNLIYILIVGLLLCCAMASGQTKESYKAFAESAKQHSVLYRGRQARQYNFRHNGHCFWTSPEFCNGDVHYNGKDYYDISLNIDASTGELITKISPDHPAVALDMDHVEWCIIGGIRYLNLIDREEGPGGLFEVMSKDGVILRKVTKQLANYIGNKNGEGIGYFDPDYDINVHDYFKYSVRYYSLKDGQLRPISKKKAMNYASH